MRRLLLLTAPLVLLVANGTCAQDITCTATTALANQHRTRLKHRDPADSSVQVQSTKVSQVLLWSAPPDITNQDPKPGRVTMSIEEPAYYNMFLGPRGSSKRKFRPERYVLEGLVRDFG